MSELERAEKRRRKKEARAARRLAEVERAPRSALPESPAGLDEAIEKVYTAARATQVDELSDEVLGYLDHIHADLVAILSHLGIERPACRDLDEAYSEEE